MLWNNANSMIPIRLLSVFIYVHIRVSGWAKFWRNMHQTVSPWKKVRMKAVAWEPRGQSPFPFICQCAYSLNLLQNHTPLWGVYFRKQPNNTMERSSMAIFSWTRLSGIASTLGIIPWDRMRPPALEASGSFFRVHPQSSWCVNIACSCLFHPQGAT